MKKCKLFKSTTINPTMKATFGAGCFWHVQEAFDKVKGVSNTTVGFMGGNLENPSYQDVSHKNTGHAEVCQVDFDQEKVSYGKLLDVFWKIHDPTQKDRQGLDVGSQYRSVIFYHNKEQKELAEKSLAKIEKKLGKVATNIVKASSFYQAEEYHQKYYVKNGKVC